MKLMDTQTKGKRVERRKKITYLTPIRKKEGRQTA